MLHHDVCFTLYKPGGCETFHSRSESSEEELEEVTMAVQTEPTKHWSKQTGPGCCSCDT